VSPLCRIGIVEHGLVVKTYAGMKNFCERRMHITTIKIEEQ